MFSALKATMAGKNNQSRGLPRPSQQEDPASDDLDASGGLQTVGSPVDSSSRRPSWPTEHPRNKRLPVPSMVSGLQSGPSSMINLRVHEEDEEQILVPPPATRSPRSDLLGRSLGLYSPPLVPMVLQEDDKANLRDWLAELWLVPAQAESRPPGPEVFEWFCHRSQAIGLQVDMCSESLCNGKIILGSYMKKPLWVDHSATTVFFMATSCVALMLGTTNSHHSAGQSFLVPCGQAYSIKNLGAVPAVMFFSWVQAESPE